MGIRKPAYFDEFSCIASACPDSCCKEWDVQVDEAAAEMYRNLEGSLGDRLRQVLKDADGETVMTIIDGRCPMWRGDGLCRIQAELSHDALCRTCREFPRLTHDYGDFAEFGLELSCPEAARIILAHPKPVYLMESGWNGEGDYDTEAMEVLLRTRQRVCEILEDDTRPVWQVLALMLLYGYQAQAELDGEPERPFDPDAVLETAADFAADGDARAVLEFFESLEILTPQWRSRLKNPDWGSWKREHLTLARYFVERYWLQAVSDYDLTCRVKFAVISCLMIKLLGGDTVETAQLYSKEIENDIDNVEAIFDGAYQAAAFTDDRLLGLLLREKI